MSPRGVVRRIPVERTMRSVKEQAGRWGVSERHVLNLLQRGELEGLRSGRRWLIPIEAEAKYLKGVADGPKLPPPPL